MLLAVVLWGLQAEGQAPSALRQVWEEWTVKHSKSYGSQVGPFFLFFFASVWREGV